MSINIGLRHEAAEVARENVMYEISLIGYVKHMIQDFRQIAVENKLKTALYMKLSFIMAKLAYTQYTLKIKAFAADRVNSIDLNEEMWEAYRNSSEHVSLGKKAKDLVKDQEKLFPDYLQIVTEYFTKNEIDREFKQILNIEMSQVVNGKTEELFERLSVELVRYLFEKPILTDNTVKFCATMVQYLGTVKKRGQKFNMMLFLQSIKSENLSKLRKGIIVKLNELNVKF